MGLNELPSSIGAGFAANGGKEEHEIFTSSGGAG
jgi:hypothetical protein